MSCDQVVMIQKGQGRHVMRLGGAGGGMGGATTCPPSSSSSWVGRDCFV